MLWSANQVASSSLPGLQTALASLCDTSISQGSPLTPGVHVLEAADAGDSWVVARQLQYRAAPKLRSAAQPCMQSWAHFKGQGPQRQWAADKRLARLLAGTLPKQDARGLCFSQPACVAFELAGHIVWFSRAGCPATSAVLSSFHRPLPASTMGKCAAGNRLFKLMAGMNLAQSRPNLVPWSGIFLSSLNTP